MRLPDSTSISARGVASSQGLPPRGHVGAEIPGCATMPTPRRSVLAPRSRTSWHRRSCLCARQLRWRSGRAITPPPRTTIPARLCLGRPQGAVTSTLESVGDPLSVGRGFSHQQNDTHQKYSPSPQSRSRVWHRNTFCVPLPFGTRRFITASPPRSQSPTSATRSTPLHSMPQSPPRETPSRHNNPSPQTPTSKSSQ